MCGQSCLIIDRAAPSLHQSADVNYNLVHPPQHTVMMMRMRMKNDVGDNSGRKKNNILGLLSFLTLVIHQPTTGRAIWGRSGDSKSLSGHTAYQKKQTVRTKSYMTSKLYMTSMHGIPSLSGHTAYHKKHTIRKVTYLAQEHNARYTIQC